MILGGSKVTDTGHRVVASSGAGPSGFVDGHDLSEIMTILGGRAVRMFLPFFETDAADDTPVQDAGPRGHHFLKHTTSDQPPYIKGHVLAYRLNGVDEAFDMADNDDFSMGADGTAPNEPAFTLGIAVRFDRTTDTTLITRYNGVAPQDLEWRLYTGGTSLLSFRLYDDIGADCIGRIYNTALEVDRWYIIMLTYDSSRVSTGIRMYLDGVRVDNANLGAGNYVAMHNQAVPTMVGYSLDGVGAPNWFFGGDVWGPFITKKCLSAGEVLSLTNLYRRVLGL